VVFPEPLGPISARNSPAGTSTLSSCRTSTRSAPRVKYLWTPTTRTIGSEAGISRFSPVDANDHAANRFEDEAAWPPRQGLPSRPLYGDRHFGGVGVRIDAGARVGGRQRLRPGGPFEIPPDPIADRAERIELRLR